MITLRKSQGFDKRHSIFVALFITALAGRESYRADMELGVDDYLIKPFTISELLNAINTRLTRHKSIEKRIKLQIRKFDDELKLKISELSEQIENQKAIIGDVGFPKV